MVIMKMFSYHFGVPSIFHFPLSEEPYEATYCNKHNPLHLHILKVFTSFYWGKEVLKKIICVIRIASIMVSKTQRHSTSDSTAIMTLRVQGQKNKTAVGTTGGTVEVISVFDPLTPRVKSKVIQSFLTFDSMDSTLK